MDWLTNVLDHLCKAILLWLNHSIACVRMRKIATKIARVNGPLSSLMQQRLRQTRTQGPASSTPPPLRDSGDRTLGTRLSKVVLTRNRVLPESSPASSSFALREIVPSLFTSKNSPLNVIMLNGFLASFWKKRYTKINIVTFFWHKTLALKLYI